jgi:hypothetical protein
MAALKPGSLFYMAPYSIQLSIEKHPFDYETNDLEEWPMEDVRRYVAVSLLRTCLHIRTACLTQVRIMQMAALDEIYVSFDANSEQIKMLCDTMAAVYGDRVDMSSTWSVRSGAAHVFEQMICAAPFTELQQDYVDEGVCARFRTHARRHIGRRWPSPSAQRPR